MIAEENRKKEYNGKKYTTYEALQQQRKMGTAMRKTRRDIQLMQEGESDKDALTLKKAKYQGQMQTYKDFSKKMGLPEQLDRVKIPKMVEKTVRSAILNGKSTKEVANVAEIKSLGKIRIDLLKKEFGVIRTDDIIITSERLDHIKERHPEDYDLFKLYGESSVQNPDFIVKDEKHLGTIFMIKKLPETNLNVVVRVVLETDDEKLKNSVMTFYRIREKNLKKMMDKNKVLYKKE